MSDFTDNVFSTTPDGRKSFNMSGEIDVNIQSQTTTLFQYLLMQEQKTDIILTDPISVDDVVVNVSAGHGFTAADGEFMVVRNGNAFFQLRVKSVASDAITIESPIDNDYPILGTSIIRGNVNMNVNGSSVPVDFKFTFNGDVAANVPIDIQGFILSFQSGAITPDDGTFGGIPALSNGVFLRKVNDTNTGLGNYTSNQEFRDVGGVIEYSDKAPAGTNATNVFIDIESNFGQVLRINPRIPDHVLGKVRDNLTGLDKFTVSILGSFTSGE